MKIYSGRQFNLKKNVSTEILSVLRIFNKIIIYNCLYWFVKSWWKRVSFVDLFWFDLELFGCSYNFVIKKPITNTREADQIAVYPVIKNFNMYVWFFLRKTFIKLSSTEFVYQIEFFNFTKLALIFYISDKFLTFGLLNSYS